MVIDVDPPDSFCHSRAFRTWARTHNLSSYDAAFLELAVRLQLPLATNDQALARGQPRTPNVPLLKF